MRIVSDTLLTFQVPHVPGGQRTLQIRQTDGTLSNRATVYVVPKIDQTIEQGRLRPGSRITLRGSGFAPDCIVRVNGQDMPDVHYIDPGTVAFTLVRPAGIAPSASGEPVVLSVLLPDGKASNSVPATLDTFRMLVFGDSVLWGEGLPVDQKFHTLVEQAIRARNGGIGFYKTTLAHCGAEIGAANTTVIAPLHGEIPNALPSILQQVDGFADTPETVDLILVDGGINDVDIMTILWPATPPAELERLVDQHCRDDMRLLLDRLMGKFPQASIVVSGYFPIVSELSDISFLAPLLAVVGAVKAGPVGGAVGWVVGDAVDEATKAQMAVLSRLFVERSRAALTAAVADANLARPDGPRVLFADPGFGPEHAVFTADPWLYGLSMGGQPQDNLVMQERAAACDALWPPQDSPINLEREKCYRASLGHPNAAGARRYADAILASLDLRDT